MFPTLVVDNFFDNPDVIVNFANRQNYLDDGTGDWPGTRTGALHEIDQSFFNYVGNKIISLFYDTNITPVSWYAKAMFQKVDNVNDYGWVHYDQELLTAIVYLSKNASKDSGTSICRLKSEYLNFTIPKELNEIKRKLYRGEILKEEADASHKEINEKFEDTIVVNNLYNRLVVFDSSQWHKANNFSNLEEERLTLIYFFTKIDSVHKPIERMRRIK